MEATTERVLLELLALRGLVPFIGQSVKRALDKNLENNGGGRGYAE